MDRGLQDRLRDPVELRLRRHLGPGDAEALLQVLFVAHQHIDVLDDAPDDADGAGLAAPDGPEFLAEVEIEAGHGAGRFGEQCVVAAASDVDAGMELGAALPHQDLAGLDDLAAEPLDAQPLSGGVAAVARAGRALLVCHVCRLCYLIPVTLRTVSC